MTTDKFNHLFSISINSYVSEVNNSIEHHTGYWTSSHEYINETEGTKGSIGQLLDCQKCFVLQIILQ